VRGIVFDLDGTLVDSYGPIASSLNHARRHFGLPPLAPAFVRSCVGRGLDTLVAEQIGPQRVEEGVRLFREHYATVYAVGTFALPQVRETLKRLRAAGYVMGVASNKPARFTVPILERLSLREPLGRVMGPDLVGSHKPEPEMIHRCLSEMGVDRSAAIYVGDMLLDVESAARAGVPVVLVPGGSSSSEELRRTGQRVLGSFGELPSLLPETAPPGSLSDPPAGA